MLREEIGIITDATPDECEMLRPFATLSNENGDLFLELSEGGEDAFPERHRESLREAVESGIEKFLVIGN
jgi:hypothetical protein